MLIADTGFWLALANRRDRHHRAAVDALDLLDDEPLVLTWPVLTETCYLLLDRIVRTLRNASLPVTPPAPSCWPIPLSIRRTAWGRS